MVKLDMGTVTGFYLNILYVLLFCHSISGWTFKCENGSCSRNSDPDEAEAYSSLELCQLMCTNYLNIWPHPTGKLTSLKNLVGVDPQLINVQLSGPSETVPFLTDTVTYITQKLSRGGPFQCQDNVYPLTVSLQPTSSDITLNTNTNESYTLEIEYVEDKQITAVIKADTVFGVRHGIETLLQLIIPIEENSGNCLVTLSNVYISDRPVYKHRGLLLDSARNYLSIDTIKRNIDGMAVSKLNVLHWHITDSQSFPFESPRLPNMTRYGAYSAKQVYTASDIQHLIEYAKLRGVRILMEIDGPSHAGNGWQWGEKDGLGNLAVCINEQPWRSYCIQPPCGQLNPINPNLYKVLELLYKDIVDLLPNATNFHMGGDEVFIACWNTTQEILDYLKDKPLTEETYLDLWGEYQRQALEAYDRAIGHKNTKFLVWTSTLTQPEVIEKYLPKDRYIIHTWILKDNIDLITDLLKLGYEVIISTKDSWYLDHGFWGSTKYYRWKNVYSNTMYKYNHQGILGGEVCMWGELVDDSNIEPRIWPRTAAAAERLWSNPRSTPEEAQNRFFAHRERLLQLGLKTEAVIPQWCVENEEACSTYLPE